MPEIIKTNKKMIRCEGKPLNEEENNTQGHPLVYLKINRDLEAECPYCGRIFVYKKER